MAQAYADRAGEEGAVETLTAALHNNIENGSPRRARAAGTRHQSLAFIAVLATMLTALTTLLPALARLVLAALLLLAGLLLSAAALLRVALVLLLVATLIVLAWII
jgi:uncharacterized membrane protein